jgi:hypothetical protein
MSALAPSTPAVPWYRERWPWFLMLGPAIVVVAGTVTAAFAFETFDGLVADDYYKQGTAINRTLDRDVAAQKLGYAARLSIDASQNRVDVAFDGASPSAAELTLILAHATRSGYDRTVILRSDATGHFSAALPPLAAGRWQLILEDAPRGWRLTGNWQTGSQSTHLGAAH